MNAASFLKLCRAKAGFPQTKLGDALGLTQQYICDWEGGKKAIPLKYVTPLADALKLSEFDRQTLHRLALASKSPDVAQEVELLREQLNKAAEERSCAEIRCFRLTMAVKNADGRGIVTDPADIAISEGLDRWAVTKAILNCEDTDSGKSLTAVAKRLEISKDWIRRGVSDPPWYVDQLRGTANPADPNWSAERQRINSLFGPSD